MLLAMISILVITTALAALVFWLWSPGTVRPLTTKAVAVVAVAFAVAVLVAAAVAAAAAVAVAVSNYTWWWWWGWGGPWAHLVGFVEPGWTQTSFLQLDGTFEHCKPEA